VVLDPHPAVLLYACDHLGEHLEASDRRFQGAAGGFTVRAELPGGGA
jgi:hypothetical protein